jgi:hypothetical protein
MRIELSRKQTEAYLLLLDNVTYQVCYGGGVGGGKTVLGVTWLTNACLSYAGVRYFIARDEIKEIRKSTYNSFLEYSLRNSLCGFWRYNREDDEITFLNGSKIVFVSLKYLPSDPKYSRFGSYEFTGGFIEEAGDVHYDGYKIICTRTGRCKNREYGLPAKVLITCNPMKNWLYSTFYKPYKDNRLPYNYRFIGALLSDNPFLENYEQQLLDLSKSEQERLLYGNWDYDDDPQLLINYEQLQNTLSVVGSGIERYLGVDVARFGKDSSVISQFERNSLVNISRYRNLDLVSFSKELIDTIILNRVDGKMVGVDVVGLGGGVVDILHKEGYLVYSIHGGDRPFHLEGTSGFTFYNLRSQMWWLLREDIIHGRFSVSPLLDRHLVEELFKDLSSIRYEIKGDRVIKVESKDSLRDRLGHSPDFGDSVVYCNFIRHLHSKPVPTKRFRSGIVRRELTSFNEVMF